MKKSEKPIPGKQSTASQRDPIKLPNGDFHYTIVTEYSEITCQFSPEKIKSLLRTMIADLFVRARSQTGTAEISVPDFIRPEMFFLVEAKQKYVTGLTGSVSSKEENQEKIDFYTEEEIREEIDFYTEEAYRKFSEALEEKLQHGPPTYIVEILTATIASLEREGSLLTRFGVVVLSKEIFNALLERFKTRWELPGSGRPKITSPRKRDKLFSYCETLHLIAKAQRNAKSRKVNKELQEAAQEAAAKVEPVVLEKVKKGVSQGIAPADIAWQLASAKYLPKGEHHSKRYLTIARKERAARERVKSSK